MTALEALAIPPTPSYSTFEVRTLTPQVGGEVIGLDLAQPLDELQVTELKAALADRGVLVLRDQILDREAHKAVGRHWGELHVHPTHHDREGHDPSVLVVKTTADSPYTAGEAWHSDVSCDECPCYLSALYITDVPEYGGGDTMFADMAQLYDMLSPSLQSYLECLVAIHDGAKPYIGAYGHTAPEQGYPSSLHPVVIVHPVTGRKMIYVNPAFTTRIKGLRHYESEAILGMLYDLVPKTHKHQVRVSWEANTITLWDNFRVQHHALWDYYPYSRYGERVSTYATERPKGVQDA